jgi:membrane fusion protein (multidrug efflux system)
MQRKELGSDPGFGASPAPAKPMTNLVEDLPQTERRPAPAARPRSRAKYVVLFLVLIAAAAGVTAYLHFQNRVSTDDATVDGHISAVAPKISGNVIEVLVKDNQPVKAGDVLVRIDPR